MNGSSAVTESGRASVIHHSAIHATSPGKVPGVADILNAMMPENIFAAAASGAMLPVVIFASVFALALTRVADANKAAAAYYSPTMFLFVGGAFLALAIERTGLHRRLALAILRHAGHTSAQLLLAVMAATALISMFVSNTSTAIINSA